MFETLLSKTLLILSVSLAFCFLGALSVIGYFRNAYKNGAKFDSWYECYDNAAWMKAFADNDIRTEFYANRFRPYDEINPWDHINYGVTKKFLIEDYKRSLEAITSRPCNKQCYSCGANKLLGRACFEYSKN